MTVSAQGVADLGHSPSRRSVVGQRALGWLEGLLPTIGAILISLGLFGAFVAAAGHWFSMRP